MVPCPGNRRFIPALECVPFAGQYKRFHLVVFIESICFGSSKELGFCLNTKSGNTFLRQKVLMPNGSLEFGQVDRHENAFVVIREPMHRLLSGNHIIVSGCSHLQLLFSVELDQGSLLCEECYIPCKLELTLLLRNSVKCLDVFSKCMDML